MRTQRTIALIVLAVTMAVATATALVVVAFGSAGGWAALLTAVVAFNAYRLGLRPWHRRWGAGHDEATGELPGDGLVGVATPTTRAITIDAPPEDVWPWLVQIGWGRAGWYSYDWIDNDGRPSADRVVPELQHLEVGDTIRMTPGTGFVVRLVVPGEAIVSQGPDGTTWCLRVRPLVGGGTRLVSRFRAPKATGVALAWMLLADPGAFVMERKMLLNIRRRAEAARPHPTPAG